jgi:hypothetical protein
MHKWEYCTNYIGPWDVMSAHYVKPKSPPPGICSFTRIRLGWITEKQVRLIEPGETGVVSLSPLEKRGETLVVKIPLDRGKYYLVENRQPIGYDRILPDAGILVLKVDLRAQEGSGTVMAMDANPDAPNFSQATFRLDRANRTRFLDSDNDIAVIPLWMEGDSVNVLVTDREKSDAALKAALEIQGLMQKYPKPRSERANRLIDESVKAFKNYDFASCSAMIKAGTK